MKYSDTIVRSWKSNATAWADAVRGNRICSRSAGTNEAILLTIGSELPCRVLDVGCGEGWLSHELSRRGFDVIGIDGSPELVQRAREGPGTFLHMSYEQLCSDPLLIGEGFDRIICNYSLFDEDLRSLLKVLGSKLSTGGILVIQTLPSGEQDGADGIDSSGWRIEDFCTMGCSFRESMPYYFRSVEGWRTELAGAGLQLFECREPPHPVSGRPLSLIMIARPDVSSGMQHAL